MKRCLLLSLLLICATCCKAQNTPGKDWRALSFGVEDPDPSIQLSAFIRRMFQDKDGNIWFGTNGDGVIRYDGKELVYFSTRQGFRGEAVRGMLQDEEGNIWFATSDGVNRYDASRMHHPCNTGSCKHNLQVAQDETEHNEELAKSFTSYSTLTGLSHNQTWCILRDKRGTIWIGTEGGVDRFDGKTFTPFTLPPADLTNTPGAYKAPKLINNFYEDRAGNMWLASNGRGVFKYDGKTLTNISEKEGLCNNFVQSVLEDTKGNMWFATRFGGICKFDGKTYQTFTKANGLGSDFGWTMLEDRKGDIWLSTAGGGLSRYDGKTLTHYSRLSGLTSTHIQSLLEDEDGNLWVGASGGAYRFNGQHFTNFNKKSVKK